MIKKICLKIDSVQNKRKVIYIYLIIWLLINLIQSFFTELHPDEAYYWMYSQKLNWGYFDHPPIIAILVKAGYTLFQNELGVRLFTALLGTLTIYIIFLIVEENLKSISLFLLLVSSIVIFHSHIGGFLAIPDLPVVFFSALFFLVYKKYIVKDSYLTAILLALIIGTMFYSKYHALLVVGFTFFANLKIARRLSFWTIPIIVSALLVPHLLWQIHNNFPTFEYHLVSRSTPYKFEFTHSYIFSQLLIAGPFVGFIVFYHAFKVKTRNKEFFKVLKVNFWGIIVFFLLMTFKGRVEAHWTAISFIPGFVIALSNIQKSGKAQEWIQKLYVPTFIIFIALRILLIFPKPIKDTMIGSNFYGGHLWADQLNEYAERRKVVFVNTFQQASKYSFYKRGEFSHAINSIHYRKNQFDIWHGEDSVQGKDIVLVGAYKTYDTLMTVKGPYRVRKIDNFRSYYDIKIVPHQKEVIDKAGNTMTLGITIINTRRDTLHFISSDEKSPVSIRIDFNKKLKWYQSQVLDTLTEVIPPNGIIGKEITFRLPEEPGTYNCYISIINDSLLQPFNSGSLKFHIE